MESNFTRVKLLLLSLTFSFPFILINNGLWAQNTGTATGVPTFQCIGITWSGSGGNATIVCNVKYRVAGSGAAWKDGYPLTFDARAAGSGTSAARPANEYRGSIVNLAPGTTYEILLNLEGTSVINSFNCTTWSENFPVGATRIVANSSSTLNITTSGTAGGYELYTPATGNSATINVNQAADNCIYVNAAYIIIRGLILKGARTDVIKLGPNAHDVVIENNDISDWGTILSNGFGQMGDAAIRVNYQRTVERIIIQRNKIHHPHSNSNSWEQNHSIYATNHPVGALAVNFETAGGNHVIRYNEIYSDDTHYFMDGIGGAENFEFEGFPRDNSDIYGNKVSQVWDDAIETEGGNMNVRVWGNYMDSTFVKIAVAATAIGPIYIFRNVANYARRSSSNDPATVDGEDRGVFIKAGSINPLYRGGKIYVFHNTILQPTLAGQAYPIGCGSGILDAAGGPMTPVVSRNNILQVHKTWWPSVGDNFSSQTNNSFNYDLYNGAITASAGQEANGWPGTPVYGSANIANGWVLASTSKGYNTGTVLNNFNDSYFGSGPDVGAYEAGAVPLEFGVNAYIGNIPPTANAGSNITLTLPVNSTALTGSGTDPDGTIAGYTWTWVSGPATYTLTGASTSSAALSNLVQGTYVFRLTVTDNNGAVATDNVTITVNPAANQTPTSNAGNNITLTLPVNSTTLNGSGADTDGTISSYAWSRVSGPLTFAFGSANAATTTLTGLVQGIYVFRLTVTDNNGATGTDDVTVTVNAAVNQPPVANAGNNIVITLPVNSTTLNGVGTDVDGTITAYAWTRVSGPATFTLGTANAATTALSNLVQGTYVFRLRVTDNSGATATDDVNVTVNAAPNQLPSANAGNNITITLPVNSTTLNGSGTDPDGTITTYAWAQVSGPATFTLGTANAASSTLTNLVQGVYVFRLTITDNNGATATDDVSITVNAAIPPNQPPIANAGANIIMTLPVNSTTLNGSSSTDPDGTVTSYVWTRISGPTTYAISNASAVTTGLTGLVQGTYVFRLTVTDNNGATATDDVNVTVNAAIPTNQPPVANAGINIVMTLPVNSATLNGGGSIDLDGTITTYTWSYVSGPASYVITNASAAITTVAGLVQGAYVFRLTVTDNNGATDIDNIAITVNAAANQLPSANAGNNITITLPTNSTTLTGTGTDIDGTIAAYAWTRISGPSAFVFGNANTASTAFTNLVQGTYVLRLTVTDNNGATATDDVNVIVNPAVVPNQAPLARAGNDIVMTLPTNYAILNGNTSSDADGVIVSYSWSRVSGPSLYTFTSAGSTATGLNNLVQGTYVFRLTVTDDDGTSATDNITVTVNAAVPGVNMPPVARTDADSIILTLPAQSAWMSGNTSTDPDGIIVKYEWTQVSGPSPATISNNLGSTAQVTGLDAGTYIFQLKVTDDDGATALNLIKVIVRIAGGQSSYFTIYPNPASGDLTLQYADNNTGQFRISIYDAMRRLVRDRIVSKNQVMLTESFDISLLNGGAYFVQLVLPDGKTVTKHFVKM